MNGCFQSGLSPSHRRGAALVVVLVLLAVVMMLGAGWITRIAGQRSQLRQKQFQVQATRLAESGLARARARLAADPAYPGERWRISADTWEAARDATVHISVQRSGNTQSLTVTSLATYPAGNDRAVRQRRTAQFSPHN